MKERTTSPKMAHVEYTKPKKKIISLEERQRQKDSLKTYNVNGDDAS